MKAIARILFALSAVCLATITAAAPAVFTDPDLSRYTFTNGAGTVPPASVHMIGNDPSGRMFLGGPFTAVDGVALPGIARIAPDGALDTTWIPPIPPTSGRLAHVDAFGRVFVVAVDGPGIPARVWRIEQTTSTPSATLVHTESSAEFEISAMATDPSGVLYFAEQLAPTSGSFPAHLRRMLAAGGLDSSFELTFQGSTSCGFFNTRLFTLVHDGAGFLYVGGNFQQVVTPTSASGFFIPSLARISTGDAATLDPTWQPYAGSGPRWEQTQSSLKATCLPPDTTKTAQAIATPDDGFVYVAGGLGGTGLLARFKVEAPGFADGLWMPVLPSGSGTQSALSVDRVRHRLYLGSGGNAGRLSAWWLMPGAASDPSFNLAVEPASTTFPPPGVRGLAVANERLLVNGDFTGFDGGAIPRINAAAFALSGVSILDNYYQSILGRAPDPSGTGFWPRQVVQFARKGVDPKEIYIAMAMFFFSSPEFAATPLTDAQFVDKLYLAFFDRPADAGGRDFWVGQIAAGLTREMVMFAFMFSPEFNAYMAANLNGTGNMRPEVGAVMDFYRGALARLPDMAGLVSWVNQFRDAQCRADALSNSYQAAIAISSAFFNSAEYQSVPFTPRGYVSDLYNAFLRRGADAGGFNFWVSELSSGRQSPAQVRQAFIDSPEFGAKVQAIANAGCATPLQ